jgi:spore maturation protein CgeB
MKVLAALLRFDYGNPDRGESLEKLHFFTAMQRLGHAVVPFWLEENGFPNDSARLQKRLLQFAEKERPDAIFLVLMKNEIANETLDALSQKYKTINWFCDDQWRFDTFSRHVAPHLSWCVTVDKYSLSLYRSIGCQNIIKSQWAAAYSSGLNFGNTHYAYEVSFVGGKNDVREWTVAELSRAGISVACFGQGWPRGRAAPEELNEIFRTSKISLNLSNSTPESANYRRFLRRKLFQELIDFRRLHRKPSRIKGIVDRMRRLDKSSKSVEQIKARNFEIPAAGGFQISQFALEVEDYFVPGKEIILFSKLDELVRLVRYYLQNESEREQIRLAGYLRASSHTYENRLKEVLERVANA